MKFHQSMIAVLVLTVAGAAFAADFTASDYRYLADHWGLKRDGAVVRNLTAEERATFHGLINDPAYQSRPQAIENHVGDYLFKIETCVDWPRSHSADRPCPYAPSANDPPGKQIADRSCIACHLVGSSEAPSFFKMARGGATARRLAAALAAGHQMSPISLSDDELRDLALYIQSFR